MTTARMNRALFMIDIPYTTLIKRRSIKCSQDCSCSEPRSTTGRDSGGNLGVHRAKRFLDDAHRYLTGAA